MGPTPDLGVSSFPWAAKVLLQGWKRSGYIQQHFFLLPTTVPAIQPCCQGAGANGPSLPHGGLQGMNNMMEREMG